MIGLKVEMNSWSRIKEADWVMETGGDWVMDRPIFLVKSPCISEKVLVELDKFAIIEGEDDKEASIDTAKERSTLLVKIP
jgi:hypothetical protein